MFEVFADLAAKLYEFGIVFGFPPQLRLLVFLALRQGPQQMQTAIRVRTHFVEEFQRRPITAGHSARQAEGDRVTNDRVASAAIPSRETSLVVASAQGERKMPGIVGALARRLINGLLTDERTALRLLGGKS